MKFWIKAMIPIIICFFVPEILSLIFFLTGCFLIVAHFLNKKHKYELISGTVVEIKERTSNGRSASGHMQGTYYTPIFEYVYKGKSYKVPHHTNTNIQGQCLFSIGQKIELRVYKKFPEKAVLNSHFSVNILLYGGFAFIIINGIITGMLLKGGKINFYSIGERIQTVFLFFYNIIEKLVSNFF